MAFISLGEALDRVLEKLAVERGEKGAGGVEPPAKVARGAGKPAREEKPGCGWGLANHSALPRAAVHGGQTHQRPTGRPGGQSK
jgi:hypothetical protein